MAEMDGKRKGREAETTTELHEGEQRLRKGEATTKLRRDGTRRSDRFVFDGRDCRRGWWLVWVVRRCSCESKGGLGRWCLVEAVGRWWLAGGGWCPKISEDGFLLAGSEGR
ncbi:hypothetical protein PIB30_076637 [Stylosanthes scabra]|uniref:Uncharacterized protein n=1 Tax=Stylosanthes scabra TaxID=79078 RepID=A0ABU6RRH8_9FABA|nr:hypothetical protein [Stylosanthes scabra]